MIKVNFLVADYFGTSQTISRGFIFFQVPFNVALKNKTSEDVSLLVIDSIVDGNLYKFPTYDV